MENNVKDTDVEIKDTLYTSEDDKTYGFTINVPLGISKYKGFIFEHYSWRHEVPAKNNRSYISSENLLYAYNNTGNYTCAIASVNKTTASGNDNVTARGVYYVDENTLGVTTGVGNGDLTSSPYMSVVTSVVGVRK